MDQKTPYLDTFDVVQVTNKIISNFLTTRTLREKYPYSEFFWSVFSRIREYTGKYGPGKTPYLDTFHAVLRTKSNAFILCIAKLVFTFLNTQVQCRYNIIKMCLHKNPILYPPTISECQRSYTLFITFRYRFLGHVSIQKTDKFDNRVGKSLYTMVVGDGLNIFQSKKKVFHYHLLVNIFMKNKNEI